MIGEGPSVPKGSGFGTPKSTRIALVFATLTQATYQETFGTALCTVISGTPSFFAIARSDMPPLGILIASSRRKTGFGRPQCLPSRRARATPALVRSELRRRSCFAIHAAIASISSPAGPVDRGRSGLLAKDRCRLATLARCGRRSEKSRMRIWLQLTSQLQLPGIGPMGPCPHLV